MQVVVRSGFDEMKASPWEKEDAMHEGIPIHNYLVPKAFTHDGGKLTGVMFEKVAAQATRRAGASSFRPASRDVHFPATTCWSRSARKMRSRGSSAISGIDFDESGHAGRRHGTTMASTRPGVFFGGDAAFGPKNIIWAVAHGHDAAISIDLHVPRRADWRSGRRRT